MSKDSQRNSAFNTAASLRINHPKLADLPPNLTQKFYRGGVRSGDVARTTSQAEAMLNKVPPSQRLDVNSTQNYLNGKHASHIHPHSKGGSNDPSNVLWEDGKANIARKDNIMTRARQNQLKTQWHYDNITGALKAGLKAVPMGAAIGAATSLPFSLLTHSLRVVRGEITTEEAIPVVIKDTAIGGGVGGGTAFAVTTVAAACPPIAAALTALSPALLAAGGVGMAIQFFKILDQHKTAVREYYNSLTSQQKQALQQLEEELTYQHQRNLSYLDETENLNNKIQNRPLEKGVEGALKRLQESANIARSLGATSQDSKLLRHSSPSLPPSKS